MLNKNPSSLDGFLFEKKLLFINVMQHYSTLSWLELTDDAPIRLIL